MSDDFREFYARHVNYVLTGDSKAALADMVQSRIPAVFDGVTIPAQPVTGLRIVDVRREAGTWVGETVYDTADGPVGLRSIWVFQDDNTWKADALENFQPR